MYIKHYFIIALISILAFCLAYILEINFKDNTDTALVVLSILFAFNMSSLAILSNSSMLKVWISTECPIRKDKSSILKNILNYFRSSGYLNVMSIAFFVLLIMMPDTISTSSVLGGVSFSIIFCNIYLAFLLYRTIINAIYSSANKESR